MADLMISYARENLEAVDRLQAALKTHRLTAWIDRHGVPLTASFRQEIQAAIAEAAAVVLILDPHWLDSKYCREELEYALAQNKRVIPLLYAPIDEKVVDSRLADIHWISFQELPHDEAVAQLVKAFSLNLPRIRLHARLLQRALLWQSDGSRVLNPRELEEAENWLASTPAGEDAQPTPLQAQFIVASRQAENRRQRKVLASVTIALLVTAALAITAFIYFRTAEARRKTAQSRLLAAESASRQAENLDLSLLLASYAFGLESTVEARGALLNAISDHRFLRRVLPGGSGSIEGVDFSDDGGLVAAGDSAGRILVWQAATGDRLGAPVQASQSGNPVTAVKFRPKASPGQIAVGTMDGELRTFALRDEKLEPGKAQEFPGPIHSLAYSPDGRELAVGEFLGAVVLLDAETFAERRRFAPDHEAPVTALAYSKDGARLAIGRGDRRIFLYDLARPTAEPLIVSVETSIASLAFSHGSEELVVAGDETLSVRDARSPEKILATRILAGRVLDMALAADGDLAAAGLQDGQVQLLHLAADDTKSTLLHGHSERLRSVAISGNLLATSGADQRVLLWSTATDSSLVTGAVVRVRDPTVLAFAPDGRSLASADLSAGLALWSGTDGGLELRSLGGELDTIRHLAYSHDGTRLALVDENVLLVIDPASGAIQARKDDLEGLVAAAFSADDRHLLAFTAAGELISLSLDLVEQSRCRPPAPFATVTAASAGDDARRFSFGREDGALGLLELESCSYRVSLPDEGLTEILGVGFGSADEVLAATTGGTLAAWSPGSGKPAAKIASGNEELMAFASAPGKNLVAIGSKSGNIELWDTRQWRRIGSAIAAHEMFVDSLAFDAGGRRLASAGNDGRLQVWNSDPKSWAALACRMAARALEEPEKQIFDLRDASACSSEEAQDQPWPSVRYPPGFVPPQPGIRMLTLDRAVVQLRSGERRSAA